jgi:hypothetical protein
MIKFRDYYDREFWKAVFIGAVSSGRYGSYDCEKHADYALKQLQERDNDQT